MDCYHIIINGLILLIFLHILLSNIDFHQVIGRPKEQVVVEKFGRQLGMPDNESEDRKKMEYKKSIQFLLVAFVRHRKYYWLHQTGLGVQFEP